MFEQLVAAAPQGVVDDLLHLPMPAAEKVIRTVAIYLGILLVIRVAGKRLMAQMNSQDLVVVLLLSNVVQNAIIGEDNSLVGGLLGAAVLVIVNAALDHWALRSPRVAWLLDGRPTVVVGGRGARPASPGPRRHDALRSSTTRSRPTAPTRSARCSGWPSSPVVRSPSSSSPTRGAPRSATCVAPSTPSPPASTARAERAPADDAPD